MLRSETGVVQDKQGWSGAAVQRGSKTQLPRPLLRRGEGAGEARARGFEVGGVVGAGTQLSNQLYLVEVSWKGAG